jgi:hypothetical protein
MTKYINYEGTKKVQTWKNAYTIVTSKKIKENSTQSTSVPQNKKRSIKL